jgi:hypothetical protein
MISSFIDKKSSASSFSLSAYELGTSYIILFQPLPLTHSLTHKHGSVFCVCEFPVPSYINSFSPRSMIVDPPASPSTYGQSSPMQMDDSNSNIGGDGASNNRGSAAADPNGSTTGDDLCCYTLDVPTYAARYDGYSKLKRLLFIIDHSKNLRDEAFVCLKNALKRGSNTGMYLKMADIPNVGVPFSIDMKWVEEVEKASDARYQR